MSRIGKKLITIPKGVIVKIFRKGVVELQLIVLAEALSASEGHAAVERVGSALSIGNRSEIREWSGSVADRIDIVGWFNWQCSSSIRIYESRQVNAFRNREIKIACPIRGQLLLEGKVPGVSARIVVVAIEDRDAGLERECSASWRSEVDEIRPLWLWTVRANEDLSVGWRNSGARAVCGRRRQRTSCHISRKQRLLLHAVRGDRSYLSKHVQLRVVDAPAGAHNGLLVVPDVPRHADPRLKHLGCVRYLAVGWESRIAQIRAICGLRWRDYRIGKSLSLPA